MIAATAIVAIRMLIPFPPYGSFPFDGLSIRGDCLRFVRVLFEKHERRKFHSRGKGLGSSVLAMKKLRRADALARSFSYLFVLSYAMEV